MREALETLRWDSFSDLFTAAYGFPVGSTLRLLTKDRRRKRSDFQVKVRTSLKKSLKSAPDDSNVKALLGRVPYWLTTQLQDRNLHCELFAPDGKLINGNTLLKTVRNMPDSFGDLEIEQEEDIEEQDAIPKFEDACSAALQDALRDAPNFKGEIMVSLLRVAIRHLGKPVVRSTLKEGAFNKLRSG